MKPCEDSGMGLQAEQNEAIFGGIVALRSFHITLLETFKTNKAKAEETGETAGFWSAWLWLASSCAPWGEYVNKCSTALFTLNKTLNDVRYPSPPLLPTSFHHSNSYCCNNTTGAQIFGFLP